MQKFLYTVDEALTLLSISRTRVYKAIASGDLPTVKVGHRRLIPSEGLISYYDLLLRGGAA
ncbi:MAG: helix-turn-helix domain-containing protein [Thermomonas sp.]